MKTRRTMHLGASPTIFLHAKRLRNNLTPAEKMLWKYLRNRQMEEVKFRLQHPIDIYIIDFYSHELKLGIEVDGEYHHDPCKIFEDENRDLTLNSFDLTIVRYQNEEVLENTKEVLKDIRERILRIRKIREKL